MKLTLGLKSILALALIILMQACGQIPSQYQGDYLDRSSGAQLNLAGNKGTLVSDGRTLMAPVAQEHAGFTTIGLGSGNKPVNEIATVLIVDKTVGFKAEMNVRAYSYFFK